MTLKVREHGIYCTSIVLLSMAAKSHQQIVIRRLSSGGGILSYVAYTGMCHCKGMVFGLSVLNRVHNFTRICPKQGMVSTIVVIKYGLYSI